MSSVQTTEHCWSPFGAGEHNLATVEDFSKIVDFMTHDSDRVVFRRFKRMNLYNLLALQHRLRLVDEKIASYQEEGNMEALNDILPSLEASLKSYNEALLSYYSLSNVTEPSHRLVELLKASTTTAIIELKHELDPRSGWSELISLVETQKGWAHKVVESNERLQKLFRQKETPGIKSDLFTYSAKNVRRAEEALLNLAFCILVIVPIFVLSYISHKIAKLMVVLTFICLSSIIASFLSDIRQKTSLALVAGYTAVLVVFLSNSIVG